MRLTKTSEYAIRVLTLLAKSPRSVISTRQINETLDIPYKYLGKLMRKLAAHGFVTTVQGTRGGQVLAHDPYEIQLSDIVFAIEGNDYLDRCLLGFPECNDDNPCMLHDRWIKLKTEIDAFLYHNTLRDILDENPQKI